MSGTTTNFAWPYPGEGDAPDGAAQIQALAVAADATLHSIQGAIGATKPSKIFTTSGSLALSDVGNAKYVKFRCQNGGGGAGGTPAVTGGTNASVSGPGAGGQYAEATVAVASITWPVAITVGAAGAGGTAGANQGSTGGTSKAVNGATTYCSGGTQNSNQGGSGQAVQTAVAMGATQGYDGTASGATGDVVVPGGPAAQGIILVAHSTGAAAKGGDSALGFGGYPGAGATGHVGFGYGSGGGGHAVFSTLAATAGAASAPGIVIVELLS